MRKKKISRRVGGPVNKVPKKDAIEIAEISARAQALEAHILKFTPADLKELGQWLADRLDRASKSAVWTTAKQRIRDMRVSYEKGVARTHQSKEGAHDYRTMMAAAQADGVKARIVGVFQQDPIVKIEGRNEQGVRNAPTAERFMDYHHDVQVNLPAKGEQISTYLPVEGHCVLYAPWRLELDTENVDFVEKQVYVNAGQERLIDTADASAISLAESEGFVPKIPLSFKVEDVKKPLVKKNWPDVTLHSLEDYLNPPQSIPGMKPLWESLEIEFTYDELLQMEKEKKIYPGALARVRTYLRSGKVRDVEAEQSEDEPLGADSLDSVLKCQVVWGKQLNPQKKSLFEGATIFHWDSQTVLQTREHPYVGQPRTMYHLRLMSVPWRFAGIGTMELAIEGERGVNDLANYALDMGEFLSALPFRYNPDKFPNGIGPLELWKGIAAKNDKDFKELNFADRRPVDLAVSNFIRGNTERRTGVGDLQLGRESDLTGKQPPTARGILSVLREGNVRFNLFNAGVILELLEFASYELKLFQQLVGQQTVIDAVGEDGKNLFPKGLSRHQLLGSYKFIPNAPAQAMARELDAELNLMLYDKFQTNILISKDMQAYYEMTKDVLLSFGKKKMWLRPLGEYMKASGKDDGLAGYTEEEKAFAQQLLAAGMPLAEVKEEIEKLRAGGGGPEVDELTQGEEGLLLGQEEQVVEEPVEGGGALG